MPTVALKPLLLTLLAICLGSTALATPVITEKSIEKCLENSKEFSVAGACQYSSDCSKILNCPPYKPKQKHPFDINPKNYTPRAYTKNQHP